MAKDLGKSKLFRNGKPGERWYANFLRRYPAICLRKAEGVNKGRAVITEECIRRWFQELQKILEDNNSSDVMEDPSRIFNADESGFSLCPKMGKVLAPKGWKNLFNIKLGADKENITVLVTFSANGNVALPLVVFPYVRHPYAVVKSMSTDWVLGESDFGWMKGDILYEYIANDFTKWVNENASKMPIILFIDGHKSPMTMPLSRFCEENGINLYALPPNTTHILQQADVSVFKPLKTGWKETAKKWQQKPENTNSCVNKTNFCQVFEEVLNKLDMRDHIKNGFRRCCLYPLNPNSVDYTKCIKNTIEALHEKTSP